jgi:RNA-directed DNA polymerase
MKRVGYLFQNIITFENLYQAAFAVLRGKRKQNEACDFFKNLEANIFKLQKELRLGTWLPGEYRSFWIHEPKKRLISAAPIRDRIVHHALIQVIEPVFERRFISHSYACRKGKGTHKARAYFHQEIKKSRYVLKMDIKKFFPSIDHEILKKMICKTIKDKQVLNLCNLIIDRANAQERVCEYFPGDSLLTPQQRRIGIPIGNLTSQFFANVYLNQLDQFVVNTFKQNSYLRYVDDFCVFGKSKQELRVIRKEIVNYLYSLRLKLNERKSRIRQLKEGIEFLGFLYRDNHIRLSSRGIKINRKRMKRLEKEYSESSIEWSDVKASLDAWNHHASYGNTWHLRKDIFRNYSFKVK